MVGTRIIPCLLLRDESLVKTVRFDRYGYIGDPLNTCRIFNELEVDELCFLDIMAGREKKKPNLRVLREISNECFMPLSYGGGIRDLGTAEEIFKIGFEKIVLNTAALENPQVINEVAKIFGSQSVIVAIDVRRNLWGRYQVQSLSGAVNQNKNPLDWAKEIEGRGAGEILLTSIDREGTWSGFDLDLIRMIADGVGIPVIAHGGAGQVEDIGAAVHQGHASAVALGSMVVYQKKGMGVLVNFPNRVDLQRVLG